MVQKSPFFVTIDSLRSLSVRITRELLAILDFPYCIA
jgi:hypothetical protein